MMPVISCVIGVVCCDISQGELSPSCDRRVTVNQNRLVRVLRVQEPIQMRKRELLALRQP